MECLKETPFELEFEHYEIKKKVCVLGREFWSFAGSDPCNLCDLFQAHVVVYISGLKGNVVYETCHTP